MATHQMKLTSEYFKKIKNGAKTIECRLFDEKRKLFKVGDVIEFTDANAPGKKIDAEIIALHLFPSFSTLFDHFPRILFGGDTKEEFLENTHKFYSEENEKESGALAIEIKLIVV